MANGSKTSIRSKRQSYVMDFFVTLGVPFPDTFWYLSLDVFYI